MSIIADGSLTNVQPLAVESRRATTPSKVFVRQGTPVRSGSAPRNNSNNRGKIMSDINLDPRVIHSGPARPISVRRQRRWENKNLFGLEDLNKTKEERILEALEHPDIQKEGIPLQISWRSVLGELLKPGNHQVLHDFLHCKEVFASNTLKAKDFADMNDWELAEASWIKIEKRIRAAMNRSFAASDVIRLFLADVERILLHFAHTGLALTAGPFSDELKKELAHPIFVDKSGNLVIPLQESAFRRLLVHGVAQFYGLQSSSVKAKGQQDKACLVRPLRRAAPPPSSSSTNTTTEGEPAHRTRSSTRTYVVPQTVVRCTSLVSFLSLRHSQPGTDVSEEGDEPPGTAKAAQEGSADAADDKWSRTSLVHLQRRLATLTVADAETLRSPASPAALAHAASATSEESPAPASVGMMEDPSRALSLSCESYECLTLHDEPVMVSPAVGVKRTLSGDDYVVVPR